MLFIWKSGDRSEDKSRTSDFRIETSPMSPVTIKTLVAVKKTFELWKVFLVDQNYLDFWSKINIYQLLSEIILELQNYFFKKSRHYAI